MIVLKAGRQQLPEASGLFYISGLSFEEGGGCTDRFSDPFSNPSGCIRDG